MVKVPYLSGHQVMVAVTMITATVMDTLTVYTHCLLAAPQKEATYLGKFNG